jgi:CBS domain-containing protein
MPLLWIRRPVREVMAAPVITVVEDTSVEVIARILKEQRIKRVPVLRDGRIVGIVSRADLVHALARSREPAPTSTEQ